MLKRSQYSPSHSSSQDSKSTSQHSSDHQLPDSRAIEGAFQTNSYQWNYAALQKKGKLTISLPEEQFSATQPLQTHRKIDNKHPPLCRWDSHQDFICTEFDKEIEAFGAGGSERIPSKGPRLTKITNLPYKPSTPTLIQKIKADMNKKYPKREEFNAEFGRNFNTERNVPEKSEPIELQINKEMKASVSFKIIDLGLEDFKLDLVDFRDNNPLREDESLTGSVITTSRGITKREGGEGMCSEKMLLLQELHRRHISTDLTEMLDEMSELQASRPHQVYVFLSKMHIGRF